MGGRSLRFTAEVVYGIGVMINKNDITIMTESERALLDLVIESLKSTENEHLYKEVGGFNIWNLLHNQLQLVR